MRDASTHSFVRKYFASAGLIDNGHSQLQGGQETTQLKKMVGYTQSTEKKRGRPVDGARAMQDSILMGCLPTPEKVLLKLKNQTN